MSKKIIALLLVLCLALSLAACSSSGSGASSQTQEQSSAESSDTVQESSAATEESSEGKDNEELSDAQKALEEAKAALAEAEARNASTESSEVNEYGITDQALQDLVDAIRENVTNDYLKAYDISPSDFAWPETNTEFWFETRFVMEQLSNFGFTSEPPETIDNLSEEDNALAIAMLTGIYEWVQSDGDFNALYSNALAGENGVSAEKTAQFLTDNVTFE